MDLVNQTKLLAVTALLLVLSTPITPVISVPSAELSSNPFQLSWSEPNPDTRYDFVFSINEPLKNDFHIESVSGNYLENSKGSCVGHSACLIVNGTFVRPYNLDRNASKNHESVFILARDSSISKDHVQHIAQQCNNKSSISLKHYCSTNWNPPVYLYKSNCDYALSWHSPHVCPNDVTNYERPCYIYNSNGKLIDLTPWIRSNGSAYLVDSGSFKETIKNFTINICNEANETCGPNVSSCYSDGKSVIESGYINSTHIEYDPAEKSAIVTSLGQYNDACPDKRVRTKVKFLCTNKPVRQSMPKISVSTGCATIIEWPSIQACPVAEVSAPALDCSIKYKPLGIDISISQLVGNKSLVKVHNINLNGKNSTMMLGICKGIDKNIIACEGKQSLSTSACLIDETSRNPKTNASSSSITGEIRKTQIRLADDRLYLDYSTLNKSCNFKTGKNFEVARSLGARIEFYCSHEDQEAPTFLAYDYCTYIFEWGRKALCLDHFSGEFATKSKLLPSSASATIEKPPKATKLTDKELKINLDESQKTGKELHQSTKLDSDRIMDDSGKGSAVEPKPHDNDQSKPLSTSSTTEKPKIIPQSVEPLPAPSKMNKMHKFFMITLIIMSLGAFIVVILILDKKTRLRLPIGALRRRTGQAFHPQPVPYSRVDDFNDSLIL